VLSPVRLFFGLAFGLTWGLGGIALLIGFWRPDLRPLSTSSPLYYLAAYSVSLAGIALTAKFGGRMGLRDLASRLIPWRSSAPWCLAVVAGYAAITGITLLMAALASPATIAIPVGTWLTGLAPAIAKDPGPVGEEFGWRGFALPRLLSQYSPLRASLTLGLVHSAWHLPLFFIPGMPQAQTSFPLFTVGVVSIAIFDTALYLRHRANLLLAVLVHLLANVGGGAARDAGALNVFFIAEGIAAALIIAIGGLERRATG
jgi:membrane protease YdiL (CAAX protease family)